MKNTLFRWSSRVAAVACSVTAAAAATIIDPALISGGNAIDPAGGQTLDAQPSAYTAIVRGVNDGTGVALVEVYALD